MKRFRFPLERLERLRSHREKIARRELAERIAVVAAGEANLARIDANIEACHAEGSGRARSLSHALQSGLRSTRARVERELESARSDAELARATYSERRRDLASLQNLHEQRESAWREEVAREEQAELDEVARLLHAAKIEREGAR